MTLAAGVSGGGLGFLIVILLILAAVGIFYAMVGSVRRMRANVSRGQFGDERPEGSVSDQQTGGSDPMPGHRPEQPLDGEPRRRGPEDERP
jgi:hypothetical protein